MFFHILAEITNHIYEKTNLLLQKSRPFFIAVPGLLYSQNTKEKDSLKSKQIEDIVVIGYKTQKDPALRRPFRLFQTKSSKIPTLLMLQVSYREKLQAPKYCREAAAPALQQA